MDLRDIEYFAVIAEHGHLGRAAEALGLGQPALSISLRRLENSAEAKLVKRTPKGVELTDVGRALLSHVSRLKLAREDLAREISDLAHGRAGHLRIGASPATANGLLADASSTLLKEAPRITLEVSITPSTDALLQAMRKGELDIIVPHVSSVPAAGLAWEPLWEDEFVVYASVRHRLARRKSVTLADLVQERWAATATTAFLGRRSLRQTFEEHGLPAPQIALTSDSSVMIRRLVTSSDLLGIGARRAIEQDAGNFGLKIIPVTDLKRIRPVYVAYRKDGYLSPVAKRLIEILKAMAKEIAAQKP